MVLSAEEHCSDYLIIARAAEDRIWLKDSAHPGLGLGKGTESVGLSLATLPGAQAPSVQL